MPLNEAAKGELATDIAAAEALAALYPDELPDSRDVRDRLATCRKYEERRLAFLTEYAALVLCAVPVDAVARDAVDHGPATDKP